MVQSCSCVRNCLEHLVCTSPASVWKSASAAGHLFGLLHPPSCSTGIARARIDMRANVIKLSLLLATPAQCTWIGGACHPSAQNPAASSASPCRERDYPSPGWNIDGDCCACYDKSDCGTGYQKAIGGTNGECSRAHAGVGGCNVQTTCCIPTVEDTGRNYRRSPSQVASMADAISYCSATGLAVISSAVEQARAQAACGQNMCRIDLRDMALSGRWTQSDGSYPLFTNWNVQYRQPYNAYGNEPYVILNAGKGTWFDGTSVYDGTWFDAPDGDFAHALCMDFDPPPDYTGTIVGISIGAIALILFIGVSGCIVARRTAPVRAVWARKRALREPLVACGLTRHLQQAGVCDDEQVLERAAAWVRANKPGSVEDIIRFGLAQSFVNSLNLPPIPQQKLLATFGGHPQHEMSVEMQQAMPVSMPIATEAVAMGTAVGMGTGVGMKTELGGGGSWFSGSAGGSSSSNQPTLSEAVAILKRELGLEGNVADVVKQAAFQLGVDGSLPLVEMARQCVQNLGVVGECA
jgi:hypothetical protein